MHELIGKDLGPGGRYRLTTLVASGGFGAVYRAWDTSLQREVALKVLIPSLLHEPAFVERFRREALAVARLRHPHILEVYDFGEGADGMLYLVMPLVEGGTLKDRFHERGRNVWSPAEVHGLAAQLLPALDIAHAHGIVHRDVKPANVLLEGDWAWLADFGIARVDQSGDGVPSETLTGAAVIGTPEYMAPEQIVPDPDPDWRLDGRADLYAFGVLMYELLTGRVPFKGQTVLETCHQVMYAPLPPPREVNPGLSPAVEAVLLQALARDRDTRFATGSDLEAALHNALPRQTGDTPIPRAEAAPTVHARAQSESVHPGKLRTNGDSQVHAPASSVAASAAPASFGGTLGTVAFRLVRAARLDDSLYDEVKVDTSTTALVQAAIVVGVTAAVSSASLTIMLASAHLGDPLPAAIGGVFGGFAGWAVFCLFTASLGSVAFKGSGTTGQLLRTAGLAQVPGVFSVVAVVPTLGILLYLPVAVWSFLAELRAVRRTLGLGTAAAVATALMAGAVSSPVQWLVSAAVSDIATQIVSAVSRGPG